MLTGRVSILKYGSSPVALILTCERVPSALKSCSTQNGTVSNASPVKSFHVVHVSLAIL